jgi:hypothetical protein
VTASACSGVSHSVNEPNSAPSSAKWILLAGSFNGTGSTADRYYPGDDVVDVVAAEGYNWQGVRPGTGRTFEQVFAGFYAWGAAHRKSMIVAGFGMPALPGRAQWITDAAATVRSWPELQAVLWSDAGDFTIGPDAVPALQAFNSPATAAGPGGALAAGLSWEQVKGDAAAAGFTDPDLDIATAITEPESGRNPLARNLIGASGLWQILEFAHPDLFTRYDWREPEQNALMAYAVYVNAGRSFTPWATYTSGAYLQYLPEAAAALPSGATAAGCPPSSGGSVTGPGRPLRPRVVQRRPRPDNRPRLPHPADGEHRHPVAGPGRVAVVLGRARLEPQQRPPARQSL